MGGKGHSRNCWLRLKDRERGCWWVTQKERNDVRGWARGGAGHPGQDAARIKAGLKISGRTVPLEGEEAEGKEPAFAECPRKPEHEDVGTRGNRYW